jgi:pyruvate dehydrogenase E1 component alpha subunit
MSLLRGDDYFITSYRDHGYALARGTDPRPLLAELSGKVTGISRGKGGSMHFYDVPTGNFGGDGIVGGHLPVAAGMGYGIRLRGTDQVVLCFFGDGAVNEGAFHEALNVSALWDLPVVYIIENNRYGMGTPLDRASSVKDLYQRGSAYGIPRREINGMDLMAVRTALAEAIERARKDKRPTLLEAETYRYRGHSMSDPGKYRSKEEVEQMMQYDPIHLFGRRLVEHERVEKAELDGIDKEVLAQVDDAVRFTEESPFPPEETLYEDVYVRSPYINMAAVEKDPAWRAAVKEDRVPEKRPAFTPAKVGR